MKELTADDFEVLAPLLRRYLPVAVSEVWMFGSGAVALQHPDIPPELRTSRDVDLSPIGVPVLYIDGMIMERELGEESDFAADHMFFVDYVTADLLRCTPPGWQERCTIIELTAGLRGHCLDPHDIAYNKLWAGRPKDIRWVHGLLGTGIITRERLLELHRSNPIAEEERAKVDRSLAAVAAL